MSEIVSRPNIGDLVFVGDQPGRVVGQLSADLTAWPRRPEALVVALPNGEWRECPTNRVRLAETCETCGRSKK